MACHVSPENRNYGREFHESFSPDIARDVPTLMIIHLVTYAYLKPRRISVLRKNVLFLQKHKEFRI